MQFSWFRCELTKFIPVSTAENRDAGRTMRGKAIKNDGILSSIRTATGETVAGAVSRKTRKKKIF
jgi:hypothetical protein